MSGKGDQFMNNTELPAIAGGVKTRMAPMPSRYALVEEDEQAVVDVLRYYRAQGQDPGYQGHFEDLYTDAFVSYMGGEGFADAVCTGTAAIFVALAALRLPSGSHVIVSPVTDPGALNAVILNGLIPVIADSMPGSFNMGDEQFEARVTDKTRAVVVVHLGGIPTPIRQICGSAERHGIMVVEDCSQAHGASVEGRKVGTFGHIAAFSTMSRKAHVTGGCGGVVFTRDRKLYEMVRACADRGKPFLASDFNDKEPGSFLFPALNFNSDEISCALGVRSLSRLDDTIKRRLAFAKALDGLIEKNCNTVRLLAPQDGDSPFFITVCVETGRLSCSKREFAEALRAEGIDINPDYRYIITEWSWAHQYLSDDFMASNAVELRENSFNILFNENYGGLEAEQICAALVKLENAYSKQGI